MAITQETVQQNKDFVQREFESAWNEGTIDEESYTDDFAYHGLDDEALDYDAYVDVVSMYRTAFPDLKKTIETCIGEDEFVSLKFTANMTHEGDLMGIEPTGESIEVHGMALYRVSDGRIAEGWMNHDALGILQQIGAVPEL